LKQIRLINDKFRSNPIFDRRYKFYTKKSNLHQMAMHSLDPYGKYVARLFQPHSWRAKTFISQNLKNLE